MGEHGLGNSPLRSVQTIGRIIGVFRLESEIGETHGLTEARYWSAFFRILCNGESLV